MSLPMSLPSFPKECFNNVLLFLDNSTLYNCLFVNRYWCRLSIPILWRDPFRFYTEPRASLINTLLACLNNNVDEEDIIYAINYNNNQTPLFEYGKFVKIIHHEHCVKSIISWFDEKRNQNSIFMDDRIQKLINIIYHIIMRQGSNLQELIFSCPYYLPEISIFTTYKPGITNLRSIYVDLNLKNDDMRNHQNAIEFLSMVSKICNGIVNCELWIPKSSELNSVFIEPLSDIIMLQPLERISINDRKDYVKKIITDSLKFRSETLKELSFKYLDFQGIDLSFMSKLEFLEQLEFEYCRGFTYYEALFRKKLHLKEFKLWFHISYLYNNQLNVIINSFCSESLLKLSLNIVTTETIKTVKESCPNISSLHIKIYSGKFLDSIIPLICELSSLKTLNIETDSYEDDYNHIVLLLGDYLTSVEYLSFDFYIDLSSFEYFANNCEANLKKWFICINKHESCKDYLTCINNYQRIHNSLKVLKVLGIEYIEFNNEESEIIDSLKNQGVDIILSDEEFLVR